LEDLKGFISREYNGREISGGDIVDYGYEESIMGWEQGFHYVKENNAQWKVDVCSVIPLRNDETMVILRAALIIKGKCSETSNLFFDTFKRNEQKDWELIRSYAEAGVPNSYLNQAELTHR